MLSLVRHRSHLAVRTFLFAPLLVLACKPESGLPERPAALRSPSPREPVAPAASSVPASVAPLLAGLEVPILDAETDPAAPAGDLAQELAAFTDVKSCAKRHRMMDPLLADAIDAIGYERLAVDACRMVEALKTREVASCSPIASSAVRRRCEEQLAMLEGNTSLCPVEELAHDYPMHLPACLAAARRDVRPCAALLGMDRARCEGVVAHDVARCGTDERCARFVQQWRQLLPLTPGNSPYLARMDASVRAVGDADAGAPAEQISLPREAAAGAVLVSDKGHHRLLIGDPRAFFITDETVGAGIGLALPDWPPAAGDLRLTAAQALVTFRHRQMGVQQLSVASVVDVHIHEIGTEPNAPVRLRASALVGPQSAMRRVTFEIDTWLRDSVVAPKPPSNAKK